MNLRRKNRVNYLDLVNNTTTLNASLSSTSSTIQRRSGSFVSTENNNNKTNASLPVKRVPVYKQLKKPAATNANKIETYNFDPCKEDGDDEDGNNCKSSKRNNKRRESDEDFKIDTPPVVRKKIKQKNVVARERKDRPKPTSHESIIAIEDNFKENNNENNEVALKKKNKRTPVITWKDENFNILREKNLNPQNILQSSQNTQPTTKPQNYSTLTKPQNNTKPTKPQIYTKTTKTHTIEVRDPQNTTKQQNIEPTPNIEPSPKPIVEPTQKIDLTPPQLLHITELTHSTPLQQQQYITPARSIELLSSPQSVGLSPPAEYAQSKENCSISPQNVQQMDVLLPEEDTLGGEQSVLKSSTPLIKRSMLTRKSRMVERVARPPCARPWRFEQRHALTKHNRYLITTKDSHLPNINQDMVLSHSLVRKYGSNREKRRKSPILPVIFNIYEELDDTRKGEDEELQVERDVEDEEMDGNCVDQNIGLFDELDDAVDGKNVCLDDKAGAKSRKMLKTKKSTKKLPKNHMTKAEEKELELWAEKFNSMIEEVEACPLEIE